MWKGKEVEDDEYVLRIKREEKSQIREDYMIRKLIKLQYT
jgi:hypothetical protein